MGGDGGPLGTGGANAAILLGLVVYAVVIAAPHARIWRRSGHSPWWALLMLVPVLNVLALWVLALKPWPAMAAEEARDGAG